MTKAPHPLGPSKATVKRREQRLRAHDAVVEAMQYLLTRNAATVKRREQRKRARLRLQNVSILHAQTTPHVLSSPMDTERKPASSSRSTAAATAISSAAERKHGGSARNARLSSLCAATRERMKAKAASVKASRMKNAKEIRAAALPTAAAQRMSATTSSSHAQAAPAATVPASSNQALLAASARPALLKSSSFRAPLTQVATGTARSAPATASSATVLPPSFAATNSLRTELLLPSHAAVASATATAPAVVHSLQT
jgi:hypothetical protein